MTRWVVLCVCLTVVIGVTGCCSCCPQSSACCPSGGGYPIGEEYYPLDVGYDAVYSSGHSDCGCDSGGQGAPFVSQNYPMSGATMSRSGSSMHPQYITSNASPKLAMQPQQRVRRVGVPGTHIGNIQQTNLSTWDTAAGYGTGIAQQSYQQAAPCNCGK